MTLLHETIPSNVSAQRKPPRRRGKPGQTSVAGILIQSCGSRSAHWRALQDPRSPTSRADGSAGFAYREGRIRLIADLAVASPLLFAKERLSALCLIEVGVAAFQESLQGVLVTHLGEAHAE